MIGCAVINTVIPREDCEALVRSYANDFYHVNLRHGVSRVRSGQRHTPGIIFHDAQ